MTPDFFRIFRPPYKKLRICTLECTLGVWEKDFTKKVGISKYMIFMAYFHINRERMQKTD